MTTFSRSGRMSCLATPWTAKLHLNLDRLLAGQLLSQRLCGAGKSATLRHLVEKTHDYLLVMLVNPEGEFEDLAWYIGATTIRAAETAPDGPTSAVLRVRHHRLPLHLDLTDLEPDHRVTQAASFFAGLVAFPREA